MLEVRKVYYVVFLEAEHDQVDEDLQQVTIDVLAGK